MCMNKVSSVLPNKVEECNETIIPYSNQIMNTTGL